MDRFEYKILDVAAMQIRRENLQAELMDKLNTLGADGWELIAIEGMTEGSIFSRVSATVDVLFILKRRITA
jgi:hypothetical protein